MVEQKPNMELRTQAEVDVPETHKKPKHDSLLMSRRRFLKGAAGVGATVMFGGFLGGCGDENKPSETSGQTTITQPTTTGENPTTSGTIPGTTESTEADQTSTTKETTIKSDLLTIQEQSVFDLPTELSNKIIERVGDVDKITYLEAKQNTDSDKKVSMWFVNSGDKDYVIFSTNEGYTMDRYSVEMEVRGDKQEAVLKYFNQKRKPFLEFKLGEEFAKKDGDTKISYLQRIGPIHIPAEKDPEKAKELVKKTEELTISDPNSIRGNSVTYASEQREEIDTIIEALDPGSEFIKNIQEPVDMGKVSFDQTLSAFEGLIITDSPFKTFEDFKNNSKSSELKANPIPKEFTDQVPQEVQEAFQKANPSYKILYVADTNRGLEMNAVITNRPLVYSKGGIEYDGSSFGIWSPEENQSLEIGLFNGFLSLGEEFVMDVYNPLKNTHRFYVLEMDINDGNNTGLGMENLGASENDDPFEFRGWQYRLPNWLAADQSRKVSDLIEIGNKVAVISFKLDEKTGLPVARGIQQDGSSDRFERFLSNFD